eukprot:TRINITY_DN15411_c0_g1_i12.p1 TRINITY_DN15411_c0_g1~~TRINITY_DN15411_c0_g1_i12.p1  ORF type:complete len:174 (+),score=47.52 TRINITY_DN15411_c0_g1_i12:108-629(+)
MLRSLVGSEMCIRDRFTASRLLGTHALDQDTFAASPSIHMNAQNHLKKLQEARLQQQRHLIDSPESFFESRSSLPTNNTATGSSAASAAAPVRRESFKQLSERMTIPHQPPTTTTANNDRLGLRDMTQDAYKELAGLTAKLNAEKAFTNNQQSKSRSSMQAETLVPAPPPRKK